MWRSWLQAGGSRFAEIVRSILEECAQSLSSGMLGDEDTQCQHLFTSLFQDLRAQETLLSQALRQDSAVPDLCVEFRYYRSRRRSNYQDRRIQFVESETGADYALALLVDLKNIAHIQRHILAQVKLIKAGSVRVNQPQMRLLEESAGGEFGLYTIWGEETSPFGITVANMKGVIRATSGRPRASHLQKFGRQFADYVLDDFLGLWHGVDFHAQEYGETPPEKSRPVLYHLLHQGEPPPNVAYFGVQNATPNGIQPGFYVVGTDLPENTPIL